MKYEEMMNEIKRSGIDLNVINEIYHSARNLGISEMGNKMYEYLLKYPVKELEDHIEKSEKELFDDGFNDEMDIPENIIPFPTGK